MMDAFSRRDTSALGRWWWTIDRWSLAALLCIVTIGVLMSFSASPAVAARINADPYFFVKRHAIMLCPTLFLFWATSMLSTLHVRRLAAGLYILSIFLLVYTLVGGIEIKGARRWIHMGGFSLQASEFIKPSLAVVTAWMLSEKYRDLRFPGVTISLLLTGIGITLLVLQPDLGMTLVVATTWVIQIFVAGLPIIWMLLMGGLGIVGLTGSYFFMPHVTKRVNQFLTPQAPDDIYQVTQSLEAFMQGGWFGRGPGEGIIKRHVPDAHADFVFSVVGEEFGLWMCLFIVVLYGLIVLRTLMRAVQVPSMFVLIASSGLAVQMGLQAFINMASALYIIPTKGMTMPFVSYGGSSLLALGVSMGMLFALTRRRHGWVDVV